MKKLIVFSLLALNLAAFSCEQKASEILEIVSDGVTLIGKNETKLQQLLDDGKIGEMKVMLEENNKISNYLISFYDHLIKEHKKELKEDDIVDIKISIIGLKTIISDNEEMIEAIERGINEDNK